MVGKQRCSLEIVCGYVPAYFSSRLDPAHAVGKEIGRRDRRAGDVSQGDSRLLVELQ